MNRNGMFTCANTCKRFHSLHVESCGELHSRFYKRSGTRKDYVVEYKNNSVPGSIQCGYIECFTVDDTNHAYAHITPLVLHNPIPFPNVQHIKKYYPPRSVIQHYTYKYNHCHAYYLL